MTRTIVAVEDEDGIRALLERQFAQEGYDVKLFPDGQAAAEYLTAAAITPDLLLLDVMMPRLDGKRLLRRIRNGEAGVDPDIPVILLTSRGRRVDVLEGFASGADDYVTKPYSRTDLIERVQRHLDA